MNGYPIFCRVFCGKDGDSSWRVPEGQGYSAAFSPPPPPTPYPSSIALRNFSRSSGLIFRHRPRNRRPPCRPGPPWCSPPKRIRHSASNPKACQKVSVRQPNSGGSSQFHKCITTSPPTKINSGIATMASGAIQYHFFLIFIFPSLTVVVHFVRRPSHGRSLAVNSLALQAHFINSSYTCCNRSRRCSTA